MQITESKEYYLLLMIVLVYMLAIYDDKDYF